ncbi:PaaI family thioesterase [Roseovarius salinarum]|uniref:PaaI family thioesterase n=1 Tax=Roseovarius salinarum TaxID=1981892 RepID=UPI000C331089|nr:PaaI family thioesterase [Roseovarius salinarum]
MTPDDEGRIRASFEAQSMMQTLGARLTGLGQGTAQIEAPILPGSRQQQGYAHAGLTFAIGDSAAGYAALTVMPPDCEVLTAEMKINLLTPAAGPVLVARGRVIKPGRRLVVVQAEVHARPDDGAERQVALLTGTMIPVETG